jgi:very-short-patch-repair endonuclease
MLSFIGNREHALDRLIARQASKEITTQNQSFVQGAPGAIPRTSYAQSQVIFTQPQFYSPLHTPQNWQIPQKRRETYQWLRHFYQNEPTVAASIDFYSQFPVNSFETQCKNETIKKYFDNLNRKLNIDRWVKRISRDFFLLGDVFPFLELNCPGCLGGGVKKDGRPCDHKGADFSRLVVLNPDTIDVQSSPLAEESLITLVPDEELRRMVWHKQPKSVYDRLPNHIKNLIRTNQPIPLLSECISHLKYNPDPITPYGTSMIRRLFRTLMYKDKLMTAQWIIAERLILPIRLVKVGDNDRPAGVSDIADIQAQLAQVANDPNLTLVTHHNVSYDWIGASGKVLQLSNEYEMIQKEILTGVMLNEALLSGMMAGYQCHDMQTRAMTRNGLKHYDEVTDDDEIACFNAETGELEYHKPLARHCADFDGELVHFQTNRIDIAVTDNHRMLFQPRGSNEWAVAPARELGRGSRFRKSVKWAGARPPNRVALGNKEVSLRDYLEIVAFYVTEGYVRKETREERSTFGDPMSACIYQTEKGKAWNSILALVERCPVKIAHYPSRNGDQFVLHNKTIACHLESECGNGSYEKRVPQWIKSLPVEHLKKFLMDMVDGDGSYQNERRPGLRYYSYDTVSTRLMNDVVEMAFKCGYLPRYVWRERVDEETGKASGGWIVNFSDYDLGEDSMPLNSTKYKEITRMPYKGRVWCFTTPTGFFVTERNGKLAIQGNSAAIGAEALIQRLEAWRRELARWIEEKIYRQIAMWKGFVDEEASRDLGEPVYIYPKVMWDDMNLRDDSQQKTLWMQLHERQAISARTLLEKFNLDYDQETERLRWESAMQGFGGQQAGAAGGAGGGAPMGGGGGAPMGGGGGAPMGGDMGAGAGAPLGGAPDAGMGGGGLGGDIGGGAAPGAAASAGGSGGKILPRGKQKKLKQPSEGDVQPKGVRLTSLEQEMYKTLVQLNLPFRQFAQFQLGQYTTDFAMPQIKLAIECDGEQWHSEPEAKAHDQKRDMDLANNGWTTLRFAERDLKENIDGVQKTITAYVYRLWRKALAAQDQQGQQLEARGSAIAVAMERLGIREELDAAGVVSELPTGGLDAEDASGKDIQILGDARQGPRDQVG